jgi:crossover junction endodeoxyribonuclease RuvC
VGIDPGAAGALAFLTLENDLPVHLECWDMPTLRVGKRSHLDAYGLARRIDATQKDGELAVAIFEQGGVRPQNGRVGAATFWLGLGEVRGIFAANFIPIETVSSGVWKRNLRVVGDKDASRIRASAMFPRWSDQWARAKDHGRAEAALIALYGARQLSVQHLLEAG